MARCGETMSGTICTELSTITADEETELRRQPSVPPSEIDATTHSVQDDLAGILKTWKQISQAQRSCYLLLGMQQHCLQET